MTKTLLNSKKFKVKIIFLFVTALPLHGFAGTSATKTSLSQQYSFATIWSLVQIKSPDIKAASSELEGARINQTRASRHWYPRLFLEGRVYSTNDPTLSFISLLGQRQITSQDFATKNLNLPGRHVFERGTLGLDLPLFEGGLRVSHFKAASKMVEAKKYELKSTELGQYADMAVTYSSLLSLKLQQEDLEKLLTDITSIQTHYKIGSKSNPIGYSGLLGLKTLRNKLQALLTESFATATNLRERIRIAAQELPEDWTPKLEAPQDFILAHLYSQSRHQENMNQDSTPALVRSMNLTAEALEQAQDAERAKFLPRIGLFGTGDLYTGSRRGGTSLTAGAYLQWDLFSASNFGATSQAEFSAITAHARAEGMREKSLIEIKKAVQTAHALEKSLALMAESMELLEEQSTVAKELFRNGSINALQFVEVMARRVDLVVSRTEAQIGLAQARATLWVNSDFEGTLYEN
jgi:outer membrane protein TolC